LIAGEPAELVDAHWLFAHHVGADAQPAEEKPVCRLPANDPWMQNMLRPIVEAAGYRVVGEGDDSKADLVIVSEDAKVEKGAAARTIRLRSEPKAANAKDRSIYRYDRAALVMALKSAGGRGR
jgi:two-component system chemotaxis sensor kinase CheA